MHLFETMKTMGHEQVMLCHDETAGYRAVIAIHSTKLGPAVGGARLWPYANDEEAFIDALRLSRGMTYKSALAGLPFGGGKALIIGDSKTVNREKLFRAHGRFVETLGGRYITAEDVGTCTADMDIVRLETKHVAGLAARSGDPSPWTAYFAPCKSRRNIVGIPKILPAKPWRCKVAATSVIVSRKSCTKPARN
jgi:leucine dehydrogenase